MKIKLYDIAVNTLDPSFYRQSIKEKIDLIEQALKTTRKEMDHLTIDASQPVKAILVAPEYFFAANNDSPTPTTQVLRQYSADEKYEIVSKVKRLSKESHDILIIPGTIAWYEELVPEYDLVSDSKYESVPCFKHRMSEKQFIARQTAEGIPAEKAHSEFTQYIRQSADSNYFQTLKTLRTGKAEAHGRASIATSRGIPKNDAISKIKALEGCGLKPGSMLLAYNSAYGFLNGEQIFHYRKKSDFQESLADQVPQIIFG